jgi:glycosyltransferase involved in cell wall biosynthesis
MTADLMFLAKNRLRFTQESFSWLRRNTNWDLIDNFVIYDDGSEDGTAEWLKEQASRVGAEFRPTNFHSGLIAGNDFVSKSKADFVAKIDNDAMYPPNWLDLGLEVMQSHPELQMLGLEYMGIPGDLPYSYYEVADADGLWIARGEIFRNGSLPAVTDVYFGMHPWVMNNGIKSGRLKPSIPVFLLDRLPMEPWCSLSREYTDRGWQRTFPSYEPNMSHLWDWCQWKWKAENA